MHAPYRCTMAIHIISDYKVRVLDDLYLIGCIPQAGQVPRCGVGCG